MKTTLYLFLFLAVFTDIFLLTSCNRTQTPGEIGTQQLLSIEFSNQGTRLDFIYDDQDTLLRIEGIRPGAEEKAQEFTYENGLVRFMPIWRITSPTEEFISREFTWNRWNNGQTATLNVYPSLLDPYNYDDTWYQYFSPFQVFPDSITWNTFTSQRSLVCQWDVSLNQLTAVEKKRAFTQNGWEFLPTDTSYLYHFDESINPLQFRILVKDATSLLDALSPTNLISVDTIFPDQSVNSFVKTIEYDNQNRPVVINYEQDGEMIREEWTYRR